MDALSAALFHLQIVQSDIEEMLESLCSQFVEKCEQKYQELVNRQADVNETGSTLVISAQFARNEELRGLLLQHPLLIGEADDGFEEAMAIKVSLSTDSHNLGNNSDGASENGSIATS